MKDDDESFHYREWKVFSLQISLDPVPTKKVKVLPGLVVWNQCYEMIISIWNKCYFENDFNLQSKFDS